MGERRALFLGGAVAVALAAAIACASVRGSPIRAGGAERTDVWPALFLALIVVAVAFYVGALYVLRRRAGPLVAVCVVAVVIQLIPLAGPLLLSRDAFSYWSYGRIAVVHHRDPATTPPSAFPADPATKSVAPGWRTQTSVYGPAFTVASAAVSQVSRGSAERASFLFRVIAALAALGATGLVALAAKRRAYAAAFLGWNPIVAISFAGGGHNDAWMVLLMLCAVVLVSRRRDAAAGGAWALAGAVKAAALALLALQLLGSRRGLRIGAATAMAGIAVASIAGFGAASLTAPWQLHQREARYSLPARLEQLALPEALAHAVAYGVLAVGVVWLARQALSSRPRLALGAALLIMTTPWVLPWYSTWPIALAAVDEDGLSQGVALGVALYLLPDRMLL